VGLDPAGDAATRREIRERERLTVLRHHPVHVDAHAGGGSAKVARGACQQQPSERDGRSGQRDAGVLQRPAA
jgi:hypothetical protein